MLKKFIILCLVIIMTGGCKKKYPDDQWPHINSPKKRLTRTSWFFEKYQFLTSYSYLFSSSFLETTLHFNKDGSCDGAGSSGPIYLFDFNGKWEFIDDDSKIKITFNKNPSYSKIWTIQQLDRGQLVIYCDSVKYTLSSQPRFK